MLLFECSASCPPLVVFTTRAEGQGTRAEGQGTDLVEEDVNGLEFRAF